jgi:hypothetical protein
MTYKKMFLLEVIFLEVHILFYTSFLHSEPIFGQIRPSYKAEAVELLQTIIKFV